MVEPNDENFYDNLDEYVTNRVAYMKVGDITDLEGLLGSDLWRSITDMERTYLFKRNLDSMVNIDEIGLDFADDEGPGLYRKK